MGKVVNETHVTIETSCRVLGKNLTQKKINLINLLKKLIEKRKQQNIMGFLIGATLFSTYKLNYDFYCSAGLTIAISKRRIRLRKTEQKIELV